MGSNSGTPVQWAHLGTFTGRVELRALLAPRYRSDAVALQRGRPGASDSRSATSIRASTSPGESGIAGFLPKRASAPPTTPIASMDATIPPRATASTLGRSSSIPSPRPSTFPRTTTVSPPALPEPNDGRAPLGVLPKTAQGYNGKQERPIRPSHDLIVYELHVKGFTARANSGVNPANRGTFAGLTEKIPYLKELGISRCGADAGATMRLPQEGKVTGAT